MRGIIRGMTFAHTLSPRLAVTLCVAFMASTLAACGQDVPTADSTVTAEQVSPESLARTICEQALLPTLDEPEAADIPPLEDWPIERQEAGTWVVTIEGSFRNMLGDDVAATWECVVLPEDGDMRLVSFLIADL